MPKRLYENLQELTGHESGLVMFDEGESFITNWTQAQGIPHLFAGGVIGLGEKFSARRCKVPPAAIEKMQAHEVENSCEPSTDGYIAWQIRPRGDIITVVVQRDWA